jgi:hypothetical protein
LMSPLLHFVGPARLQVLMILYHDGSQTHPFVLCTPSSIFGLC